ncbi:hypothetical protein [Paludibacterium denitrificans]|uniref:hypothetical protein n=1 Tax=Paludibacterium denitrificans TaxID=2675226 RepID=UPI001E35AB14|nr:hypothetical protein [Paludibacterium denitrificans]
MPDVVNEALLKTMANTGKLPKKAAELIGYLPKLKVLPCARGCEGDDYEKAVKEFIKGYNGDGKRFKLRGEMIVQVRWYNTRPRYQRGLPYGEDRFGVSFIMEGKLVSLGRSSGIGSDTTAPELAKYLGARLGAELGLAAGIGLKPSFLLKAEPGMLTDVGAVMGKINRTVVSALGSEDVTSRIEPVTDANKQLLPAIDGIQPGEIDPINEVRYLNLLL